MASSDKTEKATPKRLGEARSRGQIAKSQDLNSMVGLMAGFAVLAIDGPHILSQLEAIFRRGLAQSGNTHLATSEGIASVTLWGMTSFAKVLAPVVLAVCIAGVLANVAQVRLHLSLKPMKPNFSKLNPVSGMKRLFGMNGLVEFVKAMIKLVIVGGVAFLSVWPKLHTMGALVGLPPAALLSVLGGLIVSIVIRVGGMLLVLAFADYAYQRHKLEKQLRMTKQEVKQESRQADLAPEVRSALRKRQYQLARKRMMAEVPTADVIVVNPTHYAAALRYDGSTPAPELVAKGVDHVAAAIRALAKEHGVPIVSNPPLARTIYAQVEIGAQIPEDLFTAVAEVLAYVYRIAGRKRRRLAQR